MIKCRSCQGTFNSTKELKTKREPVRSELRYYCTICENRVYVKYSANPGPYKRFCRELRDRITSELDLVERSGP